VVADACEGIDIASVIGPIRQTAEIGSVAGLLLIGMTIPVLVGMSMDFNTSSDN